MGLKNYIIRKVDNIGAASSALVGGFGLGQFPLFLAQYVQRLGGHADEARSIANSGIVDSNNAHTLAERASALGRHITELSSSNPVHTLAEFARHVNMDVARRTLENYTPGMAFDADGLTYAAIGAATGLVAYEVGKGALSLMRKRR